MPLASYSDLQTQVGVWLARDDLATNIPDFITLFEAYAARKLKVRPMEITGTLTPSGGAADLPTGYLGWIRATVDADVRTSMSYVHPSYLQDLYPVTISDIPRFFTIEGSEFLTRSSDANDIEFVYYAKNTAVSSSLNWLFTNHPDAYLFGTLAEAAAFTEDDTRLPLWMARRDGVFDEISKTHFREEGPMTVRVVGAHP